MFRGSGGKRGEIVFMGLSPASNPDGGKQSSLVLCKAMVCAAAMTTEHEGQMLSLNELPTASRSQTAAATVWTTLAHEQLHLSFQKECF